MLRRGRFDPELAIRQTGVRKIARTNIVEFFRAVRSAHPVNLHDDKPARRELLLRIGSAKTFWHEGILRPGIDAFDDRIFRGLIELPRPMDNSVNFRRAIASFCNETF